MPHAAEAVLTSYEILMLTAPHGALSHCNTLNPAILPSLTDETPHDCLMLTAHLLIRCDNVQEAPLTDAEFPWLTDVSYLKDKNSSAYHVTAYSF